MFGPSKPLRIRERRSLNWSVAMIIALLVVIGYGAYHIVSSSPPTRSPGRMRRQSRRAALPPRPSPTASPTTPAASNNVVIRLTAVQDCWVYLTSNHGSTIYSGIVPAGSTQTWKEGQAVNLRLGNPGGVVLTVNGKKDSPGTSQPVTLTLRQAQRVSGPASGPARVGKHQLVRLTGAAPVAVP